MKFLTSESDLILNKDAILYFYSSNIPHPSATKTFNMLSKLENVLCIDLHNFSNMYKRFDIDETPTVVFMKDNVEVDRIVSFKKIMEIENVRK